MDTHQIDLVNRAIAFMEDHLANAMEPQRVATAAGYSRFHFDKLFLATLGETPADYLRKRRLSEAARELVTTHKPLVEIALDYQFQSQEAFTRAFKRMFGLSPGAYRKRGHFVRAYPHITLQETHLFRLPELAGNLYIAQFSALLTQRADSLLLRTFDAIQFFYS
jgi:AraC-like DNA-binding protein